MTIAGDVLSNGEEVTNLILELGKVGKWVQAIGLFVILWIIIQAINLIMNRKKRKALYRIEEKLSVLEKKIDRLEKGKKR